MDSHIDTDIELTYFLAITIENACMYSLSMFSSCESVRLVVLESGLGLESGLNSIFAGLGLGL